MRGAEVEQASGGNDPRCLLKGAINRNFIKVFAGMSLSAGTSIGKWTNRQINTHVHICPPLSFTTCGSKD